MIMIDNNDNNNFEGPGYPDHVNASNVIASLCVCVERACMFVCVCDEVMNNGGRPHLRLLFGGYATDENIK